MLKKIYDYTLFENNKSSIYLHKIYENLVSVSNIDVNRYDDLLCEKFCTSNSFIEHIDSSKNLFKVFTIDGSQTTVLAYDKTDEAEFIKNYVDKKTKETIKKIQKVKIKDIDYLNFADFLDNDSLNKNIYSNTTLENIVHTIWPDGKIYYKDDKYTIFEL